LQALLVGAANGDLLDAQHFEGRCTVLFDHGKWLKLLFQ
jgi:hypothetical protein